MIEVIATDLDDVFDIALDVAPSDLVTFTKGPQLVNQSGPETIHSEFNQMPGLTITLFAGDLYGYECTWGVNGHTSSYNYLVTAGHSGGYIYDDYAGWAYELDIYQGSWFHFTPGGQYLYSKNSGGYDMMRISSPQADSNCYHAGGHCNRNIRWTAQHNSWEIGVDEVCASLGETNQYECGVVLEENFKGNSKCPGSRFVHYAISNSKNARALCVGGSLWNEKSSSFYN